MATNNRLSISMQNTEQNLNKTLTINKAKPTLVANDISSFVTNYSNFYGGGWSTKSAYLDKITTRQLYPQI